MLGKLIIQKWEQWWAHIKMHHVSEPYDVLMTSYQNEETWKHYVMAINSEDVIKLSPVTRTGPFSVYTEQWLIWAF